MHLVNLLLYVLQVWAEVQERIHAVEPRNNEDRIMNITLLYNIRFSRYNYKGKKPQRNIKRWDQQNDLVIGLMLIF